MNVNVTNSLQDLFRTLLHNLMTAKTRIHSLRPDMRIKEITVQNFRLLENVELCLEDDVTLIVGRNNSGKTSLTELFRRLLDDKSPKFRIEDFSLRRHENFWKAFKLFQSKMRRRCSS